MRFLVNWSTQHLCKTIAVNKPGEIPTSKSVIR
jgi:hypothetical protein